MHCSLAFSDTSILACGPGSEIEEVDMCKADPGVEVDKADPGIDVSKVDSGVDAEKADPGVL